jgi:hypothetical protein
VALATRAPVEAEPLTASLPDHDPDPVQAVAPVLLHFNVLAAPVVTEVGFAVSDTVGAAGPRFDLAAEAPDAIAPMQTADSANTTSSLRYVTANTPERAQRLVASGREGVYDSLGEIARAGEIGRALRRASSALRRRVGSQAIKPPIAGTQIEIAW